MWHVIRLWRLPSRRLFNNLQLHPTNNIQLETDDELRTHPVDLIVAVNEQRVLHTYAVFAQSCYNLNKVLGVTPVNRLKWRLR